MPIFDRQAVLHHKQRAFRCGQTSSFLDQLVAERLLDRLFDVKKEFFTVAVIGLNPTQIQQISGNLLKSRVVYIFPELTMLPKDQALYPTIIGDNEWVALAPQQFDLVISHLQLHWVNDVPGALAQIYQSLKPGGLFLASLWGEKTLQELRQAFLMAESQVEGGASPRVSPMVDIRQAAGLLQRAGFEMPIVDTDSLNLTYDHPLKLLHELRHMGETNAVQQRQKFLRRDTLLQMMKMYQDMFSNEEGRVEATFQVLYLSGWKPEKEK